jgi:hypothetical protein
MPFLVANIVKVLFLAALFGFLAYVARAMRRQITGPAQTASPRQGGMVPAEAPPAPLPAVFVLAEDGSERRHTLDRNLLIGRGPGADVRIDDEFASERHAVITVEGTGVWIEDLGSTNGTLVDERPVTAKTAVRRGSTVVVGRTKMVVR